MIYLYQIVDAIKKVNDAGGNVNPETWVIAAALDITFDEDVYPLPIITSPEAPKGTVYVVQRQNLKRKVTRKKKETSL